MNKPPEYMYVRFVQLLLRRQYVLTNTLYCISRTRLTCKLMDCIQTLHTMIAVDSSPRNVVVPFRKVTLQITGNNNNKPIVNSYEVR